MKESSNDLAGVENLSAAYACVLKARKCLTHGDLTRADMLLASSEVMMLDAGSKDYGPIKPPRNIGDGLFDSISSLKRKIEEKDEKLKEYKKKEKEEDEPESFALLDIKHNIIDQDSINLRTFLLHTKWEKINSANVPYKIGHFITGLEHHEGYKVSIWKTLDEDKKEADEESNHLNNPDDAEFFIETYSHDDMDNLEYADDIITATVKLLEQCRLVEQRKIN